MATGSNGSRPRRRSERSRRRRVVVLRIGHRPQRDPRLTTHLALASRALGAERLWVHPGDPELEERLRSVAREWGGRFAVEAVTDWRRAIRNWNGLVVHLTMYGEPFERALASLPPDVPILLVVGGAKVPADLYRLADRNVAVGSQPHSEVAAAALALDRLTTPPDAREFSGARRRIVPQAAGKRVRVRPLGSP